MELSQNINSLFWKCYVWLPPNVTWEHMSDISIVNYAQFRELHYVFPIALVLLVARCILNRFLFAPFGRYLGLKHNTPIGPESPVLEKAFNKNGRIGHKQVQGLAKQLDWSERKVERWLHKRISRSKPSTLTKFTESAWRFTFYSYTVLHGLYTLWDKPCFTTTSFCWYDYPHHSVTNDVWWYYMLELGFYWSLIATMFVDTKRKDFVQMFIHHIISILQLTISWMHNLILIGSLVIFVHDVIDVPLEAAKMAKYVKYQKVADVLFAVFTFAWIITRLWFFPFRIIYSTMFESLLIVPMFPAYYVLITSMCILQVVHIVWTWMIFKVALRAVSSKNPGVKDVRSDSEESSDESSTESKNKETSKS